MDARRLSDLGRDCELLATVMTWFRAEGNITRAAERLNSSRRALRLRIYSWRDTYPEYVPPGASKTSARKTRGADDEATNDEPTRDAPPASPSHPSSPEEAAP